MTKKERTAKCYDCGEEFLLEPYGWIVCPKCRRKKKWRTWRACRELAAKYREPEGEIFFTLGSCPLCKLHTRTALDSCRGCPLARKCGDEGCYEFNSNDIAQEYHEEHEEKLEPNPAFEARAAFFDKIIPILEKIPASRFTKKGWKYFNELDRSW